MCFFIIILIYFCDKLSEKIYFMKLPLFILNIILSFCGIFIKINYREYYILGNILLITSFFLCYYLIYILLFKKAKNN